MTREQFDEVDDINCDKTSDIQPNEDLSPSAKEKGNEVSFHNDLSELVQYNIIRNIITKNMRKPLSIG